MYGKNKYFKQSGLILLLTFSAILMTSPSWSEGIDWDGSVLENNNSNVSNKSSSSFSNLPGVRRAPKNARQDQCKGETSANNLSRDSTIATDGCTRKTPLLVIRGNNVSGLLFDLGR